MSVYNADIVKMKHILKYNKLYHISDIFLVRHLGVTAIQTHRHKTIFKFDILSVKGAPPAVSQVASSSAVNHWYGSICNC